MKKTMLFIAGMIFCGSMFCQNIFSQTTEFTYQGKLSTSGAPANVNHDFEFALFNGAGAQLGATLTRSNVVVTNGIFTVSLDFGSEFPGANRFLEIRVRPAGSGGGYQQLLPRQPITSAPYSIKSVNADNAATAGNALQLGGVAPDQFVRTNDTRLSNARDPLPGSGNYIQNQNAGPQASSDFNISGSGTLGGTLTVGAPEATVVNGRVSMFSPTGTNLLIRETTNDIEGIFGMNAGSGVFYGSTTSHNVQLRTGNAARMTIDTVGNLGIGTGSPTERLHVAGNGLFTGNLNVNGAFTANGSGISNLNAFNITSGTLNNARLGVVPIVNGGTGSATQNFVDLTNAQTIGGTKTFSNTLLANSNVGVGNSSPLNLLSVGPNPEATTASASIGVFTPTGTGIVVRETTNDIEGLFSVNSNGVLYGSTSNHNTVFRTNNAARLTITAAGSVGIGTGSPTDKLDVSGNIHLTGEVRTPATGTANMLPLAYGHVQEDGSASGSGNFSVSHVHGTGRYDISIPGENFSPGAAGYTVLVQVMNCNCATVVSTSTVGGNLLIQMRDPDGTETGTREFSFLIFKP